MFVFFFQWDGDHLALHVLTHSVPTRRSSYLARRQFGAQAGEAVAVRGGGHACFLVPTSPPVPPFGRRSGRRSMRAIWMVLAAIATPALVSAQEKETDLTLMPSAPVAEQRLHETMLHGPPLSDPSHWLRAPSHPVAAQPEVLANVKAENAGFEDRNKVR